MGEDLAIGDMGAMDPFGLAVDIPEPDLPGADGMDATLAGPGGPAASLADVGLAPAAAFVRVDEGVGASFSGQMDTVGFASMSLGSLPSLEVPDAPRTPDVFSAESTPAPVPQAYSSPGVAALSDAPVSQEGLAGGLSQLQGLEPPAPPLAPFAGVSTAPDEFLDLQLALSPPEPSQEGFSAASEAPMSGPSGTLGIEGPGPYAGLSRSMAESISTQAWGGMGAGAAGGGVAAGRGASIHVENLHLPAASTNEMLDQLLSTAPDLTSADLSGLAAA